MKFLSNILRNKIPLFPVITRSVLKNIKMPQNVEIKAKVHDIQKITSLAEKLSGSSGELIVQEDTFFNAPNGRLKLRVLKGQPAQLIFYTRADQTGPKLSNFFVTEISSPESLKETLGQALGVRGQVKKRRMLYMIGHTRVHIDQVEGLGDYMELEVQLQPGQTVDIGEETADVLREKLQVSKDDLITGAYMDLLLKK